MDKIVLVTGASSGIGKETAKLFAQSGYKVYAAARRVEKMEDLQSIGARIIKMDVADEQSIADCVEQIIKLEGKIDILVNSAGFGLYGAIEDVSIGDARYQLE